MTIGDIPGWLNVIIGVAGLYFLVQTYRKDIAPRTPLPMETSAMPHEKWLTPPRQFGLWAALIVLAWASAAFSFYLDQTRVPNIDFLFGVEAQTQGRPLGWDLIGFDTSETALLGRSRNVLAIDLLGENFGTDEITLDDAYFISGLTGKKLEAKIWWDTNWWEKTVLYKVQDINPIPPKTIFRMKSDWLGPPHVGLTAEDFLQDWSIIYFVAVYNGQSHRVEFSNEAVNNLMPGPPGTAPRLTLRRH